MFTKFCTGSAVSKTHLRVPGFNITPVGAKTPKAACGAKVTRSYVPMPDNAEVTCLKCQGAA